MIKKFEEFINEGIGGVVSGKNVFIILLRNDDYHQEIWKVSNYRNYNYSIWKKAVEDFKNAGMDDLTNLYLLQIPENLYNENIELINKLKIGVESEEKEDERFDILDMFSDYVIEHEEGGNF